MHFLKLLSVYDIHPKRLLHIGAHRGQEASAYQAMEVETAIFVEAIPAVFQQLQKHLGAFPGYVGICAVCSDTTGAVVDFNVSSNEGGSSSLLGLGNHANLYPSIHYVEVLRLESITADDLKRTHFADIEFDMVVLDTQGAEMKVLRGATALLQQARALSIEVSEEPLYEGGCTFEQVVAFVRPFGFRLRHVQINRQGWGDALFVRT